MFAKQSWLNRTAAEAKFKAEGEPKYKTASLFAGAIATITACPGKQYSHTDYTWRAMAGNGP